MSAAELVGDCKMSEEAVASRMYLGCLDRWFSVDVNSLGGSSMSDSTDVGRSPTSVSSASTSVSSASTSTSASASTLTSTSVSSTSASTSTGTSTSVSQREFNKEKGEADESKLEIIPRGRWYLGHMWMLRTPFQGKYYLSGVAGGRPLVKEITREKEPQTIYHKATRGSRPGSLPAEAEADMFSSAFHVVCEYLRESFVDVDVFGVDVDVDVGM